jgi:FAD/FMN-containing dehydrogenase
LPAPRDAEGRFVNWTRTVVTKPAGWREPVGDEEIAAIVRDSFRNGRRVRVVGAGHAFDAIAAPDDLALTLDRDAGIVGRPTTDRVTVRAGTRLRDLNAALAELGLALPIVGSISRQSIAGAIATGTHGSSLTHGNLSSLVHGLRIVTGRGEVLDLSAADPRLDGARVNLGALGIVTELTLAVTPAFRLAESAESRPIDVVKQTLEELARSSEYVKIWWWPHVAEAQVYRYERTNEPVSAWPSPSLQRWIDERILHRLLYPVLMRMEDVRPAWVPAINGLVVRTMVPPRRIGPSTLMLSTPFPTRHRETEAAVPLTKAAEALDRLTRLIDREHHLVNAPVEIRFVRGDRSWISPAFGADTCHIGIYMGGRSGVDAYFEAAWREMRALGARPHWGKEMRHRAEELAGLYPEWDRFLQLREVLDPERRFANRFLERILDTPYSSNKWPSTRAWNAK